ncbi:MAG TPA: D-alanine--poly(phosphoribitol) ligase subunit DltA [Symbiobacteriaceae bacterium]|nr:D-alanine--poly(phosphoribitol) ligase subunit DltA [Symbiobacteriaceae bacterium]
MPTILQRIHHFADTHPDRLAHVSGERTLTYRELWERSDDLAVHLLTIQPGDSSPVVVRGHKEPEMLIAFLGAVKAGRAYVPIDTTIPSERAQRIVQSSGSRLVLHASHLPAVPAAGPSDPATWVGPDDPYYIIYTSGSTGEPKGVQITRACLESFVDWMLAEQHFAEADEVFLNQAPFSFDLSVMDLYCSLATGGTLFSLEKPVIENPKRLFAALAESGVTTWVTTPSFAVMCLAERSFDRTMLPRAVRFLFCGETLPPDCAARLTERFPGAVVWNTYGPTEATVATTSVPVTPALLAQYNPLPVGYPKPDSTILVVDEQGRPVAEGERGEIVIIGPHVSIGYLNSPALTEKAFYRTEDGRRAYRTGDRGRYQDGLLFFEGRIDFQIKLHGYRIELGDIEAHLRALPGVEDAVVLPALKEGVAQWLAGFVVISERPEGSDFAVGQGLRQALGARLPAYMLPRKFFLLESFPMTPNGKADRRQLAERLT